VIILCGELFNMMAGIQAIHVPYKGGAPAVQDVIPGASTTTLPACRVGLPLATYVLGSRRPGRAEQNRFLRCAERPTIAEQGLPQYEATLWAGIFAPSSIDPALAARIAADGRGRSQAARDARESGQGRVALFEDNQANFKKFFHADIEKWRISSEHPSQARIDDDAPGQLPLAGGSPSMGGSR